MQSNDAQIGGPGTPYRATKAVIEALNAVEGAQAYATDTHEMGFHNGTAWVWGAGGGEEHDHDADYYTKLELQTPGSASVDWQNIANRPALGTGDMEKSIYDPDNDGVVDNAAALGGIGPEGYSPANHSHPQAQEYTVIASALDQTPAPLNEKIWAGLGMQLSTIGSNGNYRIELRSHEHISDQRAIYVNATTGNDGNSGDAFAPLATIGAALSMLKGQVLSGVVIDLAPGVYDERVTLAGLHSTIADLLIRGDGKNGTKRTLSSGYMHGAGINNDGGAYQGSGNCTLSSDNGGPGGRMRVTVSGSVANPNFLADGIDATNEVALWNGTNYYRYVIYSVSGNVLTLDTLTSAPALNANGRYVAVLPNVVITDTAAADHVVQSYVPFTMTGCHVISVANALSALRVWAGQARVKNCYFKAPGGGSIGSVYLTNGASPTTDLAPNVAVGGTALHAFGGSFMDARGFTVLAPLATVGRGLSVGFGSTSICDGLKVAVGTAIGVYAEFGSYAGARWFANNASTQYSPPTSDTPGNYSAIITHV